MTLERFKEEVIEYNFDGKFLEKCIEYLGEHRVLEELCTELIYDKFSDLDELIENCITDKFEAARAVYFGKIYLWNDDYFFINAYGNIESQSKYQYYDDLISNKKTIMNEIINFIEEEDFEQAKDMDELIELIEYYVL